MKSIYIYNIISDLKTTLNIEMTLFCDGISVAFYTHSGLTDGAE
jgi:hypothetical protein